MPRSSLALFFILALPTVVAAEERRVLDVLSVYRDLNDMCLGRSGDGLQAARACNVRAKVARLLNGMGYCYGNQSEDAADMQWHKCSPHELF